MAERGWGQSPRPYLDRRLWLCCGGVLCYRTQIQTCQTGELTSCSPLIRAAGLSKILVGKSLYIGHNPSHLIGIGLIYQTKIGGDQFYRSPHIPIISDGPVSRGRENFMYPILGAFMVGSWYKVGRVTRTFFPKKRKKKLGYALRVCVDQLLPAQWGQRIFNFS